MAKDQSFAAKLARGDVFHDKCSVCGETISMVKVVDTEDGAKDSVRFKEGMVGVCKCNEKEVYA
ncbi:hypothetical protein JW960_03610 [candidate division KSB1 bacterium]|nr:hypothetical protein [candidate division KSB1 bacterium]